MNRSYSKIRHIQEANKRLENRLLIKEEDDLENSLGIASSMISKAKLNIDPNELVDADVETCAQPETGDPKENDMLYKISEWAYSPETSIEEIDSKFNEVLAAIESENSKSAPLAMAEQVATPIVIAGLTLSPPILIGIGAAILLILIIAKIKKNSHSFKGCRRRRRLIKKHGFQGNFM